MHAVDGLLGDPVRAAALGAAGRRRVLDDYSWDARLAPLDRLLGGRAAAVPLHPHPVAA